MIGNNVNAPWGMELKTYCSLMHLSQLLSFLFPGLGFIAPLVMWLTNKDKHEDIDTQGRKIANWVISLFIYSAICGLLVLVGIGLFGLGILAILNLVFVVIAAIKAKDGISWTYPLSIQFFK